ncbi:MAG: NAD(+) diphosphatase [Desulfovibrio sp.]|nr:NAD(+) diphosphatase [Desulfovibrio sp.]
MPPEAIWFLFNSDRLLLRTPANGPDALCRSAGPPFPPAGKVHILGRHEGILCKACLAHLPGAEQGFVQVGLRAAYDILGEPLYRLAGKGREMIHWEEHTRHCPACGTGTEPDTHLSQRCPGCGRLLFPHITPAILALVRRRDRILLVRARTFTGPHYGLVAGFLEPGESLEECARREVLEETGLAVGNLTYFGSQPWPYPSGLMVGFVTDNADGEILLQEEELIHAAFFPRLGLPALPHPLSLARRMIDAWILDMDRHREPPLPRLPLLQK